MFVYNAILFVYISVLKASIQWKSTEKWVLQISKKTTFNYQDFIPTYLRLPPPLGVKNVKIQENSEKIRGPPGDPYGPSAPGPLKSKIFKRIG